MTRESASTRVWYAPNTHIRTRPSRHPSLTRRPVRIRTHPRKTSAHEKGDAEEDSEEWVCLHEHPRFSISASARVRMHTGAARSQRVPYHTAGARTNRTGEGGNEGESEGEGGNEGESKSEGEGKSARPQRKPMTVRDVCASIPALRLHRRAPPSAFPFPSAHFPVLINLHLYRHPVPISIHPVDGCTRCASKRTPAKAKREGWEGSETCTQRAAAATKKAAPRERKERGEPKKEARKGH
ncbi:hypothetical protein B0H13DRAFT_2279997 [Mycena leptocephala]|nr:hypothetical protein B0H13DRAFT_2279997 [Mycena leptocephala]